MHVLYKVMFAGEQQQHGLPNRRAILSHLSALRLRAVVAEPAEAWRKQLDLQHESLTFKKMCVCLGVVDAAVPLCPFPSQSQCVSNST